MAKRSSLTIWIGLALVVVGLPFLGHWFRQPPKDACALDGGKVDPLFRVRIVDDQDESRSFCCISCATMWLDHHSQSARAVFVTDERTGQEMKAGDAYYVRSSVVTRPTTGSRIHVFANRADAERHAAQAGGTVLDGAERPFHAWE